MLSALLSHLKTVGLLITSVGFTLSLLLLKLKSNKVEQLEVKLVKVTDAQELAPIDRSLQEAETNVARDEEAIAALHNRPVNPK